MNLLPHNEKTVNAVREHFKHSNRAAVIQSTGTGKSWVIGAIAEEYNNVLLLAPNEYVLGQAMSINDKMHPMTYSYLERNETPTGYDLICLDEFHRVGAKTWESAVDDLLAANPQAKVLGTTATPIRHLEQRNMADVLFKDDIVTEMYLSDAWCNNILKAPTYVIGLSNFDSTARDYITRINSNKRITKDIKNKAIAKVNNIARSWSLAGGVATIFRKYIDKSVRRMIVFAPTINKVQEIKVCIIQWLIQAGLDHHSTYFVYHNAKSNKKSFAEFADEDFTGIKVMIAVDMLNEGIHIPDVDCAVLLRSTISKNLYLQQIGRCFSIGNKHKPIVLDLADNLFSANGYDEIYQAHKRFSESHTEESSGYREEDAFTLTDEIKSIRELMAEIDHMISNDKWDVMLPVIRAEYERCGHLPTKDENKEVHMYIMSYRRKEIQESHPERIEILRSMGFVPEIQIEKFPYDVNLKMLDEYLVANNGEIPPSTTPLGCFVRNAYRNPQHRQDMIDRGYVSKPHNDPAIYREYIMTHDILPSEKENKSLRTNLRVYIRNVVEKGQDTELIKVINEKGFYCPRRSTLLDTYKDVLENFVKTMGRFPCQGGQDKAEHLSAVTAFRHIREHDPSFIEMLIEKYGVNAPKTNNYKRHTFIEKLLFAKQYDNPKYEAEDYNERRAAMFLSKLRNRPLEQWQVDACKEYGISLEKNDSKTISLRHANEFIAYYREHGECPPHLFEWWRLTSNRANESNEAYVLLRDNGLLYEKTKILDRNERIDILEKAANGETVRFSKPTLDAWRGEIFKTGTPEQIARLKAIGMRFRHTGHSKTCKDLEEYIVSNNVKVIRKKDSPLCKKICRVMSGEQGTDEDRSAYQAILDKYGVKLYTFESQWLDTFNECYELMKRTGFYPRKRIPEEDRFHDWLIAQRDSDYPPVLKMKHLLYEHNMIYPDISRTYRPNIPWIDKDITA